MPTKRHFSLQPQPVIAADFVMINHHSILNISNIVNYFITNDPLVKSIFKNLQCSLCVLPTKAYFEFAQNAYILMHHFQLFCMTILLYIGGLINKSCYQRSLFYG